MIRRAAHRRVRAAAAVAAHPRWRPERDAVRAAYRVWTATTAFGEPLAIEAYQSALDGEERAADTYARLMSRVPHPAEIGPAHQRALTQALPGAWERQ
jgi:hypothetical protein